MFEQDCVSRPPEQVPFKSGQVVRKHDDQPLGILQQPTPERILDTILQLIRQRLTELRDRLPELTPGRS